MGHSRRAHSDRLAHPNAPPPLPAPRTPTTPQIPLLRAPPPFIHHCAVGAVHVQRPSRMCETAWHVLQQTRPPDPHPRMVAQEAHTHRCTYCDRLILASQQRPPCGSVHLRESHSSRRQCVIANLEPPHDRYCPRRPPSSRFSCAACISLLVPPLPCHSCKIYNIYMGNGLHGIETLGIETLGRDRHVPSIL